MDVPYFINEHLWTSACIVATLKKTLVEVNPPQVWPWKQNDITAMTAQMILEVVNKRRSVLQINILKKS